ncbi:MAG: DUF2199 domain-containing protein [Kiloniellales bacterium]
MTGNDSAAGKQVAFSFVCPKCGDKHEGSPSIGFASPHGWDESFRAKDPESYKLTEDLCIIDSDRFIRCILEVPILEAAQPFLWGVWVSQSQENFRLYAETFESSPERVTFGYLCNRIPEYADTLNLHMHVHWQSNNQRPWLEIEPAEHRLYYDWKDGIAWDRAMELALPLQHQALSR